MSLRMCGIFSDPDLTASTIPSATGGFARPAETDGQGLLGTVPACFETAPWRLLGVTKSSAGAGRQERHAATICLSLGGFFRVGAQPCRYRNPPQPCEILRERRRHLRAHRRAGTGNCSRSFLWRMTGFPENAGTLCQSGVKTRPRQQSSKGVRRKEAVAVLP